MLWLGLKTSVTPTSVAAPLVSCISPEAVELGFFALGFPLLSTSIIALMTFSGTPYLWGGSSSFGLDCSGFVQLCYLICGITLRRDADIQRNDPRFFPVERNQLQPGDLVFFGKPDRITHVGMHLEGNAFIHAAGGAGVIITEWGDDRYSPGYVDARRLDIDRIAEPVTRFEAEDR